ncbi:cell division protein FtsQ/DivIB [Evansella sp. AB-P1]|uniref:cell division protein FtsQ/DivIB n=1 Tax=Evansella sp. AB-P1 TaxID=3037653 RepID=UPI00241C04DB|nr:cell division protein FtsQ/DivIB [Evansella sp. AB-P1]MDG5788285.1 cell division protein FtsQ/DivIB [Evansella sp. AB-P1]
MSHNKKVIEIEERIPKLKNRRKQLANRRLIFYISIFFILVTIIMYFQSSFSLVKTVEVSGNIHVSEEWIVDKSQLLPETSMWNINEEGIRTRILSNPEISSLSITKNWPNTIHLEIGEYERVAYVQGNDTYYPLLETGKQLSSEKDVVHIPFDAPILMGFTDEDKKSQLAAELVNVSSSIRNRISEIYYSPVENDTFRLMIYMNDGFVVNSTIRNFAERIAPYTAIVEQLDPNEEGIVHMRMNPYFESFEVEEEEESESEG